jgi:glycosyl transferase family 25
MTAEAFDKERGAAVPLAVNAWVDKVYVLSVKTFTQRIEHVRRELARHGIEFEFMFAHDAVELDQRLLAATFAPSDMKATHQSLVLKNIQVWRDALEHNHRRILVFEDDAVLAEDFVARFDAAMRAARQLADGYLIYLGGADAKVPDSYFRATGPLVELPIATTEGYVTDLAAIRRRLVWLESHKVTQPADHLIRRIDAETRIKQYWLNRPIVEQGSVLGIFPSVLDGHRQKYPAWFNRLRNRWKKFQRHTLRRWLARPT